MDNTLEWTPHLALKWSDFQAESNPAVFEDSHSVIKYRFTWTVNSDSVNDKIVFIIKDINLFVEFHSMLSWMRPSELDASLLCHEQGNFDLAESVKRENLSALYTKFYTRHFPTRGQNEEQSKQFAKEDSGKMIDRTVQTIQSMFDKRSLKYRTDTNHGQNTKRQSEYDMLFKQLRV